MATRRNVYTSEEKEKRIQSPTDTSPPDFKLKPGESELSPVVPSSVIVKLIIFTTAMITFPLGTYFIMLNYVTQKNSTLSGAAAAIMANVVLIAYVITALSEDDEDNKKKR